MVGETVELELRLNERRTLTAWKGGLRLGAIPACSQRRVGSPSVLCIAVAVDLTG